MADGAYFVGRHELLAWINSTLDLNVTKVEQTASGAIACQLMDALFPGEFPMHKVDYNAKNEYEMINNYKTLQAFFTKKGIEKTTQVNKLIKGRPLDNMEFMQWLKAFFDRETGGMGVEDYDPVGRRMTCKTGDFRGPPGSSVGRPSSATKRATPTGVSSKPASGASRVRKPTTLAKRPGSGSSGKATPSAAAAAAHGTEEDGTEEDVSQEGNAAYRAELAAREDEIKELTAQVSELRLQAEESLREREFYYGKLREVEILCQTPNICDNEMIKVVEQILYAPNEEQARDIVRQTQMEYAGQVYVDAEEQNGDAGQENGG
ncbi:unnamed protein product [Ostreobium quekettii]|uniref:Microtubule-associated protein RP/EB family member 1 n=1 Tax=Ostreobium quekettii TaxID=121088 RepID=A0A8S1IR71_9CHLO|nr:unnamed protein product [Ostreobium quekettii]|eukprot:evm.model.scf_191.11 EVM.evm.TU.scf_191.11   scf_191:81290-83943(-)